MMKKIISPIRFKAASAALALLTVAGAWAAEPSVEMLLPQDLRAPRLLRTLAEFPASLCRSRINLALGDIFFSKAEYAAALEYYNRIADNAFSGDVADGFLFRKAFSLMKVGYYAEAAATFARISDASTPSSPAYFYIAYLDYVGGDYDRAYTRFQAAQRAGGEKAGEAAYYINQIDFYRGDYRKVANAAERLLAGDIPDELKGETLRVSGIAFFKTGDKTRAQEYLQRYVGEAGTGAELTAVYSLATILYDRGDYDAALPLFSAVTEDPGALAQSAWLYIGQILQRQGDASGAALAFDKAARQSWDSDVAETAAYNLAVSSGSGLGLPFADAAGAMENFIESYPSSPYAANLSRYLANAYYGKGDYANALRQVEKISPQDASAKLLRQKTLYMLGVEALRQGRLTDAERYLTEASASSAPDKDVAAQAALWLGETHFLRKDYRKAAASYEAALASGRLGANTALARYDLGYAYLKLREYAKARNAFKSAIDAGTLSGYQLEDARMRYADCLYYTGAYADALAIFRSIAAQGGQNGAYADIRVADIQGRNGNVAEKISILERVVASDQAGPWQSTALARLADAYTEKGDDRKAAELYARMLGSGQNSEETLQTYYSLATNADNLYNTGDFEAAYKAYRHLESSGIDVFQPSAVLGIMRTSPSDQEVYRYAAMAEAIPQLQTELEDDIRYNVFQADRLLQAGRPAEAEKLLTSVVDAGSSDSYWLARAYIALADAYAAQEKDYLARLYLETLRDNYPGKDSTIPQMISSRLKALQK